ncbi:MAG: zinc ribbon domain-containing protein [Elusimicrobiaceae bacterium]|nr:zinc ribbon domain-containing protein [Elusimicrobiaceae bacterium]
MNELPPQQATAPQLLFCTRCHGQIDETDNYCRSCGKSLKPGRGFLFTHTGIILMACILGPFALPFVWMSKAISPLAKIIYTAVLLLIGFYLLVSLYKAFSLINNSLQMMMGDLNNLGNLSSVVNL